MSRGLRVVLFLAGFVVAGATILGWTYISGLGCAFGNVSPGRCRVDFLDGEFLSLAWAPGLIAAACFYGALKRGRRAGTHEDD